MLENSTIPGFVVTNNPEMKINCESNLEYSNNIFFDWKKLFNYTKVFSLNSTILSFPTFSEKRIKIADQGLGCCNEEKASGTLII